MTHGTLPLVYALSAEESFTIAAVVQIDGENDRW